MSKRLISFIAFVLCHQHAAGTFSIVAYDQATGTVGCAVSSCVGDNDAALVCGGAAGFGVVASQAEANEDGRDEAVKLLKKNTNLEAVVSSITSAAFDKHSRNRQYGVCNQTSCTGFTGQLVKDCYGESGKYSSCHAGSKQVQVASPKIHAISQGNVITGNVLKQITEVFFSSKDASLSDRLMAALIAGANNGEGDVRCVDKKNIASDSAHIWVEALPNTGISNVSLSVIGTGTNQAVIELEKKYTEAVSSGNTFQPLKKTMLQLMKDAIGDFGQAFLDLLDNTNIDNKDEIAMEPPKASNDNSVVPVPKNPKTDTKGRKRALRGEGRSSSLRLVQPGMMH
jgi:uncharacterized Ntn-hydrolase superfamily protein